MFYQSPDPIEMVLKDEDIYSLTRLLKMERILTKKNEKIVHYYTKLL